MEVSSSQQVSVFFIYILSGIVCGAFFDTQRFLRRLCGAGKMRTFIEDFFFVSFCVATVIGVGLVFNNGELRYYQFMGAVSGVLFYGVILSGVFTKCLNLLFFLFCKILVKPLMKILGLIMLPVKRLWRMLKVLWKKKIHISKRFSRHRKKRRKHLKKRMKML